MNHISKKTSLIILAVTSIVFSRIMFMFFNDPEGPNLLVTVGTAVLVYFLSFGIYVFTPSASTGFKKLILMILAQIIIVTGLYFCLS